MPSSDVQPDYYRERRSERIEVETEAGTVLRRNASYSVEIRVRNVSQCGFMAECSEPVTIGSYVSLDVPGIGAVNAQVRWQIGLRMGGMFLDPISLNRCEWTATRSD